MENLTVLLDTSILIDYFRKTDKSNSVLVSLNEQKYNFAVSVITQYEIFAGVNKNKRSFWKSLFETIKIIPFDQDCVNTAVELNAFLKKKSRQIDIADLFIASTAISYNFPISTLNRKHFERIEDLKIIE